MKFTKSLMMPIVLSILGIFTSVSTFILIQVAGKVNSTNIGASPLPIILLVMFVLFLGALSAKKALFARVLSIISISGMTLGMFITAIVCAADFQTYKIGWDSISFLAISIFALVAAVLFLIYNLIGRNGTLKTLAFYTNVIFIAFIVIFAVILMVSSFVGVYKNRPLYGIELALVLVNVVVLAGLQLSLHNNLVKED